MWKSIAPFAATIALACASASGQTLASRLAPAPVSRTHQATQYYSYPPSEEPSAGDCGCESGCEWASDCGCSKRGRKCRGSDGCGQGAHCCHRPMPQHHPYFPVDHGYYYFRPYNYRHIYRQQEAVLQWGGDPRHPYANQIFQSVYAEMDESQLSPPEPLPSTRGVRRRLQDTSPDPVPSALPLDPPPRASALPLNQAGNSGPVRMSLQSDPEIGVDL